MTIRTLLVGALKVAAIISLLPLVAVAALGLTICEIFTPATWTTGRRTK